MSAWYFDPHSGGTPVPPRLQEEIRKRILLAAEQSKLKKLLRLEIRFRGALCYVDAYEEGSTAITHLFRLRYFSGRQEWSLAFFTYSDEKYKPCAFRSGQWFGTPEEAWETVGSFYLI